MITLTMQQMENVKNDRKRSHAGTTQQTEASRTTGVTLFPLRMDEAPRGFLMRTTQAQDMVNAPKLIKAYEKVQDRMIRKL